MDAAGSQCSTGRLSVVAGTAPTSPCRELASSIDGGPEGWTVHVDETWGRTRNVAALPRQGWKLHVSSTVASVEDVLRACVPVLLEAGCQFKVARDRVQVEWLTHPSLPRETPARS